MQGIISGVHAIANAQLDKERRKTGCLRAAMTLMVNLAALRTDEPNEDLNEIHAIGIKCLDDFEKIDREISVVNL
jgi:hypothetical protein